MTTGVIADTVVAFTRPDGTTGYAARILNSDGQIAAGTIRPVAGRPDVIDFAATASAAGGRLPTRDEAARLAAVTWNGTSRFTPQSLLPGDRANDTAAGIAAQRNNFQGNPLTEFGNSEKIVFSDNGVPNGRVGIYGARGVDGNIIQNSSTVHGDYYFDYSHTGGVVILDEPPPGAEIVDRTGELTPEQEAEIARAGTGVPGPAGGSGPVTPAGQYSSFADCMMAQNAAPAGGSADPAAEQQTPENGVIPSTEAGRTGSVSPVGTNRIVQNQVGAGVIRNEPIQPGLAAALQRGIELSGVDAQFVINSGGQVSNAEGVGTGSIRHNHGSSGAADGDFFVNGRRLDPTNAADRETLTRIMQGMWRAGIRGFGHGPSESQGGDYMGYGRFHLDLQGNSPGRIGGGFSQWGGDTGWIQSAIAGIDPGSLTAEEVALWERFAAENPAAFINSGAAGAASVCSPYRGGNGCSPVTPAAIGAAASVAQGQGIGPPEATNAAIGDVVNTALGGAAENIQALAAQAANALPPGLSPGQFGLTGINGLEGAVDAIAVATGGLNNVLTQISAGPLAAIQNIGSQILPGITGVVPAGFAHLLGGGSVAGFVTAQASQIIGNSIPQLGNFIPYLNSAIGAVANGGNMQALLNSVAPLAFGQMQDQLGTILNQAGFGIDSFVNNAIGAFSEGLEGLEGLDAFTENLQRTLGARVDMLGPLPEVLGRLTELDNINAFSSLFGNYNDMVTQGFGAFSSNINGFGRDLANLGRLGDLRDIFNLGTPTQLARQIVENGVLGAAEPILERVSRGIVNLNDNNSPNQDQELRELFTQLKDPLVLQNMRETFQISDELRFDSVADLIELEKILPNSRNDVRFNELRDIAPTITLCGGVGRMRSLGELGNLLRGMENTETFTELNQELAPIRRNELNDLFAQFPSNSFFGDTPVIADFIGTAAGYIHDDVFAKKAILLDEIYATGAFNNYKALMDELQAILSGEYSDEILEEVDVPASATFGGGTYTSLDEAITDIVSSIEAELESVRNDLKTNDPDTFQKLVLLESLHLQSARYLAHEKNMRMRYGVEFGNPDRVKLYRGDGSTASFSIGNNNATKIKVFVNGVKQRLNGDYTFRQDTFTVDFNSAPAGGSTIEIEYRDSTVQEPVVSNNDVWGFANSLESYAEQTGFGNTAEFLFRVTKNDFHGQRIKAAMMQGRNKRRIESVGINCPGTNRVDGETDAANLNYIERTGIWSADPDRAGEIWLYNQTEKGSYETYYESQLKTNRKQNRRVFDRISFQIADQLMFYNNGRLNVTTQFLDFYDQYESAPQTASGSELLLSIDAIPSREGYALGPYKEIISEILKNERFSDINYNEPLSNETKAYLQSANIDIKIVVTLLQKIMLYNLSKYFNLTEKQVLDIYEVPSVSKAIFYSINNNLY